MAGRVFHLTGETSEFTCQIFPPLKVSSNAVLGLTHFQVYNSIPNVDDNNCNFKYKTFEGIWKNINIETGTYELADIEDVLKEELGENSVSIIPNPNTLKCVFWCKNRVDFTTSNTIGTLFGMPHEEIEPEKITVSKELLKISRINTINVEVNIVSGSFNNGVPSNCVYKCFITTPPGFRIVDSPMNITYLPITVEEIDNISIKLTDEDRNLINFRGEEISIELHLKLA